MSETAGERLRNNAVEITSILITGLWLSGLLLTDQNWWLGVLIVGYAAVIPLVQTIFGDDEDEYDDEEWSHWTGRSKDESATESDAESDPLETLRERYARGELTDEQFERKLERLLETETIEDVEDRRRAEREPEFER
ncbi:Short C-terminal domain-containing protein [Natronoarchaeum philippinense]|uniref:Short C-terminal domain-containing protein n=1 Tax=Natronoarchaeum philippinense TaxID=558529 RepID=A0A285NAM7_NATPI|nr:SHOCT domain-containing protein [Natronoarchaeum philippinense]SNZ05963.1 Short C-terminal domain-containing protein [Natronoarchaeum philippinense]